MRFELALWFGGRVSSGDVNETAAKLRVRTVLTRARSTAVAVVRCADAPFEGFLARAAEHGFKLSRVEVVAAEW